MTVPFPNKPEFTGSLYKPARFEGQVYDLEVEGKVPEEIDGTFFQVAPDPQYPPMLGEDIFFNGDGAVSAFRFKNGHVDFQRRYVMTERLKAQRDARASCMGSIAIPLPMIRASRIFPTPPPIPMSLFTMASCWR